MEYTIINRRGYLQFVVAFPAYRHRHSLTHNWCDDSHEMGRPHTIQVNLRRHSQSGYILHCTHKCNIWIMTVIGGPDQKLMMLRPHSNTPLVRLTELMTQFSTCTAHTHTHQTKIHTRQRRRAELIYPIPYDTTPPISLSSGRRINLIDIGHGANDCGGASIEPYGRLTAKFCHQSQIRLSQWCPFYD